MSYGIYPEDLAEMFKSNVGQKYRPSNGTEGECFFSAWCCRCARDKSMREGEDIAECDDDELCEIIGATMRFNVEDENYPKEWQYDKHGQPCCTAYIEAGQPIPSPRCERTVDMFETSGC